MLSLLTAAQAATMQGTRRRAGSALARALDRLAGPGNLLPAPGSVVWNSASGAVVTGGQADPAGGTAAWLIVDDSADREYGFVNAVPYVSGSRVRMSLLVKKDGAAANPIHVILVRDGGAGVQFSLDLGTGATVVSIGTVESLRVIDVGWGWLVRLEHAGLVATQLRIHVYPADSHAGTGSVTVYGPRIEYVGLAEALRETLGPGNLLPGPGSLTWITEGGASATTGAADPAGGTGAVTLTDTDATSLFHHARTPDAKFVVGHEARSSIILKKDASAPNFVRISNDHDAIYVHLGTGAHAVNTGAPTEVSVLDLGAWWKVLMRCAPSPDLKETIRVHPAIGHTASFPTPATTAIGSVTVYGPRIEDPALMAALRDTLAPGNLLPPPSYLTWSPVNGAILTTGQTDPAGGTNAIKIDDTSGGAWQMGRTDTFTYVGGRAVRFSAFVKKDPAAGQAELRLLYSTGKFIRAQIHPATGAVQTWGTPPAEPADEISAIDLGSWWKLTARHSGDALATNVRLDAFPAISGAINVGSWTIYGARIELL